MDKKELRAYFKNIRKAIPRKNEKSLIITEKFINSDIYKKSETIMLFYPLATEVNTLFLLEKALKDGKKVVFPKTVTETNEIIPLHFEKGFIKGAYNIYEPISEKISDKNEIDTVVVPALACDCECYRLGYGGGYYDRFLADFSGNKVTFLFKELITDRLPREKTDIKTDIVITD